MVIDRRRRLLSYAEFHAKKILEDAVRKYRGAVAYKIRLRDALKIQSSGLEAHYYDYATRAHFDFVVQDHRGYAIFAIEWDGPHHDLPDRIARDEYKNFICDELGFPLFRVNCGGVRLPGYNRILKSIIECWFNSSVEHVEFNPLDEIARLDDELFPYGSERSSGLTALEALKFLVARQVETAHGVNEKVEELPALTLTAESTSSANASAQLTALSLNRQAVLAQSYCKVPLSRAMAAPWLASVVCLEAARSRVFEFM